jgi:hypothetical protein
VTLLVVAILLAIVLTFSAMIRLELRGVSAWQSQQHARAHAVLAVNLAIAQLQAHTGPDQRVTGPADIEIPSAVTIHPDIYNMNSGLMTSRGTTGAEALQAIDSYWSANRNRNWVGVWRNVNTTAYNPLNAPAFNPEPGLQNWLVSGNESIPGQYQPGEGVSGLDVNSTPLDEIIGPGGRPYRLLVKSVAGVTDAASLPRAVTAPQVNILSQGATVGRYAWWVGDEGVKARVDLVDPYASDASADATLARRKSAQRPVLEAMSTNPASSDPDLAGLAPYFPIASPLLNRVSTPGQFAFLHEDEQFQTQLRKRFHEVTLYSRSVLANVKNGGLRADLTHILSNRTANGFRADLTTAFHGAHVTPSTAGNIAITPAATPYAEIPNFPGSYPGYAPPDNSALQVQAFPAGFMEKTATWEQLWSFYNMGNTTADSPAGVFQGGTARARLPTPTQQGITPILVQGKVFYRLEISGGTVRVGINPMVVLANPYPVPLSGEFTIRMSNLSPRLFYGDVLTPFPHSNSDIVDAVRPTTADPPGQGTALGGDLPNSYLGSIRLVARATGIPPGEAQIFTVDPSQDLTIASASDNREVTMIPEYDSTVFLTYNTGRTVPVTSTGTRYVGLWTTGGMNAQAHMGEQVDENRFVHIATRHSANPEDVDTVGSAFRVFPFPAHDGGKQGGGGVFFTLHDGYSRSLQQPLFSQLNYRGLIVDSSGANFINGKPLQWSIYYSFPGQRDQSFDDPPPLFGANILLPPDAAGIPNTTRWGLVNTGGFPSLTTAPPGINGFENACFVNLLYDIPQPGHPITSLGQLQHFNLSGSTGTGSQVKPSAWLSNYSIANSYATPRVPRDLTFFSASNMGSHYDATYIWNDILWDRFFFSSFPSTGDFDFDNPADKLVNARHRPFRERGSVPRNDPSRFRGGFEAAENLLLEGGFNVNSTSVDAWKAVLSGLKGVEIGDEIQASNLSAPFTRTLRPFGSAEGSKLGNTENAWSGFRNLTEQELHDIAEEMVLQVRLRGPFLSLSSFVNRRLARGRLTRHSPAPADTHLLGVRGALQAAIDKVINQQNDVSGEATGIGTSFRDKLRAWDSAAHQGPWYGDIEYRMPNRISGFPGYLLQGDVLSAIGPSLSARSDTFVIRAYGDAVAPGTSNVNARAWCEAVVQRLPDYVDPGDAPGDLPASPVNQLFGRRYHVLSFRWLTQEEI